MTSDCNAFRAALEAELLGRRSHERLASLGWHEHLLGCGPCRDLLEKEEALEILLASLPEPRLPEALTRRVLLRLRQDRAAELRLDSLLDAGLAIDPPERLSENVLVCLAPERRVSCARTADARLDALLESVRQVEIPSGLAARTLARLLEGRTVRPGRSHSRFRPWFYAVAAGLLAIVLGRWLLERGNSGSPAGRERLAQEEPVLDPRMLAALDVLEQWDLLMQDDLDVLLSTLGPADEALLDYR